MSAGSHRLKDYDARHILGVDAAVDADDLQKAFRTAVKQAHPDLPGGNDERLRLVIEAYRTLKTSVAPAARQTPVARPRMPLMIITPEDAAVGGWRSVRLDDGRTVSLHLPIGLREAELLSVDGRELAVSIAGDGKAAVMGDHLCLTVEVEPGVLRHGGRLTVETPNGPRDIWVSGGDAVRGLVRVAGQGLPGRGQYAQGHLFVRLIPDKAAAAESEAQSKLRRFTAAWAA
jgi:curved DNA-binding protein